MRVSPSQPFQIIYSLFQHEYLGYLFESFVVQLDDKSRLTFQHQNISSLNAAEFSDGLDANDYELIRLMDSIQQDVVIKKFYKKKIKPADFFLKIYNKDKGNEVVQAEIEAYLERRRGMILELMYGKMLFEMGNDGEPAWRQVEVTETKATVLFHFRRNEENTHYFPTIKHEGEKVEFYKRNAYILCREPAWLVIDQKLYSFAKDVDGNKLQPFLNKKFILIPKKVEETYYRKFVAPLVASFDVYAKGFEIKTEKYPAKPCLTFTDLEARQADLGLFDNASQSGSGPSGNSRILFDLNFQYADYKFKADQLTTTSVYLEKDGDNYTFHRISRNVDEERKYLKMLKDTELEIRHGKASMPRAEAIEWINQYKSELEAAGFTLNQNHKDDRKYFIGSSSISIEVKENIDWFDIYAKIVFGEFEIPFQQIRKLIVRRQRELKLPNGEIAIIPEAWFTEYSELFAFMDDQTSNGADMSLKKHHLALVQELESGNLAKVTMSSKLEKLRSFDEIDDIPLPKSFEGTLRPYQKAGFNWMHFLNKYNFGGCLADDMGLGKTVQTLAMLQSQKEEGHANANLLIMPTSLIYNWEMEARKFTPNLKVFIYTGTNRDKNADQFDKYDLVLTSYGIVRLDIEILQQYYFNYIILDESQAIKNPNSNIAKSVKKLKSRQRLILTGTPLENSTLDLWSQMTFINPGLLGNQSFFKNEFLNPIEKKKDEDKSFKLHSIIKPFILRRHKSQVATELPEKIESIQYSTMTAQQEKQYEEAKSYFRNKIFDQIEQNGLGGSQFMLLQGLTKLRQIANHPRMVDPEYTGDSGKLDDVCHMLLTAIGKDHKILVFSQFVKHLQIIKDYLEQHKIRFSYLDGSTRNRQAEVDRFQNDEELQVFLISLKAGGLGLNLTKADYVFILDPWWNPAIEAQAVDRAHRIGQKNNVFTYKFITKNSVEEKILALQQRKLQLATNLITTEESFVKNLTQEDIENLLL
ncbi:DEAD/DEAH box helicase [Roseivirga sp. BDSF3-8]|uniref:DEAD/DEAH box helicase n=1 Tax=Roseivirga sp. BDSF3-8 TaxID=3241598 RepID=UPI0035324B1F